MKTHLSHLSNATYGVLDFAALAGRREAAPIATLKRAILMAFAVNLLLVALGEMAVFFFGQAVLHAWVGEAVAQSSAGLNLIGGATMLSMMAWSLQRTGVHGLAMARIWYGLITLLMYVKLVRILAIRKSDSSSQPSAYQVYEGV